MPAAPATPPRGGARGPLRSGPEGGARVVLDPQAEAKAEGWTRVVCFSDTHGRHGEIPEAHRVPADLLLHAGDFTNTGETDQVQSFEHWLRDYPAKHKVVIAGNHDLTFDGAWYEKKWRRFHSLEELNWEETKKILTESDNCIYLEDTSVEVLGYRIYGSPYQPEFCDWAFNLPRGQACRACWDRIPQDVDVLLTHGPAHGFLDLCSHGGRAGCEELLKAIRQRAVPLVLCGHIHEGYGTRADGPTLFANASTCTLDYIPTNPPIVLDLPPPEALRAAARTLDCQEPDTPPGLR